MTTIMSLEAGQHIGQYTVIERIGSGGMAEVYKAQHRTLARTAAIKVMHTGFADDPDLLARFKREAQIVAALEHPNIVPVYDFADRAGQPYLVMKFIEGRTLKWHMRKRALSLHEISTICGAIADALTYAHAQGVLHRDVKPSNVMIDADGKPHLTDFGLARLVAQGESSMSSGMIVGTPHYLSPEQASGEHEIGPATDVYALGVMLYEMVVGRVPFDADTPHAIVFDQIYTPPPTPSDVNAEVPPSVEAVLLRALKKVPAARYPTPNALMGAFEAAIAQSGLTELREDRGDVAARSIAAMPKPKRDLNRVPDDAPSVGGLVQEVIGEAGRLVNNTVRPAVTSALVEVRDAFQQTNDAHADRPYTPPTPAQERELIRQRAKRRLRARRGWQIHMVIFMIVNIILLIGANISSSIGTTELQAAIAAETNTEAIAEMKIALTAVNQPWFLIVTLFWLGGLLAHRVHVRSVSAKVEDKRERVLLRRLTAEFGDDWQRVIKQRDYTRIEKGVHADFCRRTAFWAHLQVFIFGNVALMSVGRMVSDILYQVSETMMRLNETTDAQAIAEVASAPLPLAITFIWLFVLVVHGFRAFRSRGDDLHKEIERERTLLERRRTPQPGKRKHALEDEPPPPAVRLTADGELTASTVEAWDEDAAR